MEKQTPHPRFALPEHLQEPIDISEINGDFRDFVEQHLFVHFPAYEHEAEEILAALLKAKSAPAVSANEALTLQVITFLKKLKVPLHDERVSLSLKYLGAIYWPNCALEYFAFLVAHGNYPTNYWQQIFNDYENALAQIWLDKATHLDGHQPKPIEEHLTEGLVRNLSTNPLKESPLSIYFWFNPELWKKHNEDENTAWWESDSYPENKELFSKILHQWASENLKRNNEDAIYTFLDWAEHHCITLEIKASELDLIDEKLRGRPVSAPTYPIALKDVPALIRALQREQWSIAGEKPFSPTEEDEDYLHAQLIHIAELCANDCLKAKLPNSTIRDLLPLFRSLRRDAYEKQQNALSIKFLALMRNQIEHEPQGFNVYDYKYALNSLVNYNKEDQALRQLLITMRKCSNPCSNESLNFRPPHQYKSYASPANFDGLSPEYCVSCLIDILIDSWQVRQRLRELCLSLADFFISRLKFKQKKGRTRSHAKLQGYYNANNCLETDPKWRRAYAEALGELGYADDGKVLHVLDFVRKHDPDEDVRDAAQSTYRTIHREQTKDLDDFKSLRAAFWALRKAQREALHLPVKLAEAKLLKRQELRSETQTRSDIIYNEFLRY